MSAPSHPSDPSTPDGDPVEALLAQALDRLADEGPAAVEALCARHPEQAPVLRRRLELLAGLGALPEAPGEPAGLPERVGPYRILSVLGRGGMGVVYRARDEQLGREVALKVVRPEHLLFPGARERFRREVETVARLHHPGIVPVYAVGETDGVPWFAMERVAGCSLADVLEEVAGRAPAELTGADLARAAARRCGGEGSGRSRPESGDGYGYLFGGTWEQACLRILRQVAEALEHAHQRGVVHRDLKPSNVMVTFDPADPSAPSRALLLDFGLTTGTGAGSGSGIERLTRTGARIGSPLYMSPEQARGEREALGPTTDVYALGATLYELLTLSPPARGSSDVEIARSIQSGDRPPVRKLNPAVSWEAETVCLTALEPEPARRYATAADLARDLANVLELRPVEARRASRWLRGRRWVQRHPARTVALVLGSLLVVGGPSAVAVVQSRARERIQAEADLAEQAAQRAEQAADLAEQRRLEAERGRAEAETEFTRAVQAIDDMLARVGSETLRTIPHMETVREGLLTDAIALYRGMLGDHGDDPLLRRRAASAQRNISKLTYELGRPEQALQAADAALKLLPAADGVEEPALVRERAAAHSSRGTALLALGRLEESEAASARAVELLTDLHGREPDDGRATLALGGALHQLAFVQAARGALSDSVATSTRSVGLLQPLVQAAGDAEQADTARRELAGVWNDLGLTLLRAQPLGARPEAGMGLPFEQALPLMETLAAEHPDDPDRRLDLVTVRNNLAGIRRRQERFDEAESLYRACLEPLEQLVERFALVTAYRVQLATTYHNLAMTCMLTDRRAEAESWCRRSLPLLEEAVARTPSDPDLQSRLGIAQGFLGELLEARGELDQAAELVAASLVPGAEALRLNPEHLAYADDHFVRTRQLVHLHLERGAFLEAARVAAGLGELRAGDSQAHTLAMSLMAECVAALREAGGDPEVAEAIAALAVEQARAALAAGFRDTGELATAAELAPLRGTAAFGALLSELGLGGDA